MKSYPFVPTGLIALILVALLLLTAAPQPARAAGLIIVTSTARGATKAPTLARSTDTRSDHARFSNRHCIFSIKWGTPPLRFS
jgi:hypothetical protein